MNFLYPQFLFGLLALAIPIIIHLFNFRKTKKIYFSSNRFLRNIKESNSSRLKVKHWLVLASRLLFLLFLVLAFAQPFIPSTSGGLVNRLVKIYIDNSYSMSNETAEDVAALDRAVEFVEEIVQQYPRNTRFQVLSNEFNIASESLLSYEAVLDYLTEISLTPLSRELEEVLSRLKSSSLDESADVYLVSDFQKSTTPNINDMSLDSLDNYYFVPIPFIESANVFVDSVFLTNPFLFADNANEINVKIRNSGSGAVNDLILRLFINEQQVATGAVSINENASATVKFPLNFQLTAINNCRIAFEDFPVTYDNLFYFTLNTTAKIEILEIRGEGASDAIKQVYGNDNLFVFDSYNVNNIDYNLINSADLIFLNEFRTLSAGIKPYLQNFVDNGGTLVLVFNEDSNVSDLAFLALPEAIQKRVLETDNLEKIEQPDLSNPFFSNIFESTEENIVMPMAANVVTWSSAGMDILRYRNGTPFISRSNRDNIYYIGTPLKEQFTNFHNQALFVPIMYRLAALSQAYGDQLYYYIDEGRFSMRNETLDPQDVLKLQGEAEEIIPTQFQIGNKLHLEIPKYTLNPGFYDLKLDQQILRSLAFNFNKEESYLEQYSEAELQQSLMQNFEIIQEGNVKNFGKQIKEQHQGTPLWKYCLVLSLLFLLAEVLLIRFL